MEITTQKSFRLLVLASIGAGPRGAKQRPSIAMNQKQKAARPSDRAAVVNQ